MSQYKFNLIVKKNARINNFGADKKPLVIMGGTAELLPTSND
jgi:hypothetical protein